MTRDTASEARQVRPRTVLLISQVYVPDPAAVGQHVADAARELARRGHHVVVLTSARGYADPTVRYARRELRDGVHVRRLPLASFGKGSILLRLLGAASFLGQALLHGLLTRRLAALVVSTSPPMCTVVAVLLRWLRRVRFVYWVMDINPDQAVALGHVRPAAMSVRAFERLNRRALRSAHRVVALDRYMAARLERKSPLGGRLVVVPPWPPLDHAEPIAHAANPFRRAHRLGERFVFMYSGNHSPSHPLATVLDAARRLEDDARLVFVFVGAGLAKADVERAVAAGARNVVSLPYQPLERVHESLAAADVHLVSFGDAMVGIVHPSKVYGAMAVGRPIVLIGPRASHVGDLIDAHRAGWCLEHGDVDAAVRCFRAIAATPAEELAAMGRRARAAVRQELSREHLCGAFVDVVERTLAGD